MKQITVTITSSESVILRIERFLALLHLSSAWGHTCTAAMDIDGDGSEKVIVSGIDISAHARYIEAITRRPRTKSVDWVASEQEAVEHSVHLTGFPPNHRDEMFCECAVCMGMVSTKPASR